MFEYNNIKIERLGHAGFKISNSKTIFIDPFHLNQDDKADIVLITHGHYDHCSLADINRVLTPTTQIFATPDCSSKLRKINTERVQIVSPNKRIEIGGIAIETVPAYNLNKQFHPRENEWLGYIVEINGTRIYHSGDTDLIPEMQKVKADIVLLPVGGTYTMNAEEAAQAANLIKPKVAIPMHYGDIVGQESDAEKFKLLCKVQVEILG